MHVWGGRCQEVPEDARTGHYRPHSWSYSVVVGNHWRLGTGLESSARSLNYCAVSPASLPFYYMRNSVYNFNSFHEFEENVAS